MDLRTLIRKGLLGYQPIFFPNGVISGAGFQFFGNLRSMRSSSALHESAISAENGALRTNDSVDFNRGRIGNLYIPPKFGDRSEFDSEFYYCVDDKDLGHFAKYNLILLRMYQYFARKSLELSNSRNVQIDSMIEIGSNTCLFPAEFSHAGVTACHGCDIVDYSSVVDLLSLIKKANVTFHHMPDDSEATWRGLPKADLVWSYAVILHQSNPLAHLTRLASLGKKAMFVMTLCEPDDWRSKREMGIRYLSANSYYNADFPNCFDVTIVSPELIRYSLKRLGFSNVIDIPRPDFDYLDEMERRDLDHWMKKHCFFLAFRDAPLDAEILNEYSVSTERSPYKGENVLVHSGYHHNVVLSNSRYLIVPHGKTLGSANHNCKSFSSLNNAMEYFGNLKDERNPYPIKVRSLEGHALFRFKNRLYLCPKALEVNFDNADDLLKLHVLDSMEKWEALLALLGDNEMDSLDGIVVDFIDGICVTRTRQGTFKARRIGSGAPVTNAADAPSRFLGRLVGRAVGRMSASRTSRLPRVDTDKDVDQMTSDSLPDLVKRLSASMLQASLNDAGAEGAILYRNKEGEVLRREAFGNFQIQCERTGSIISTHGDFEEAWSRILRVDSKRSESSI